MNRASDLKLDVDQAGELKAMFRRERASNGREWTNEFIKILCERKGLGGQVLDVIFGNAEIKPVEFWRVLEDIAIPIPVLKHPTLQELQKEYDWIRKIDGVDTSPTEAVTLRLGTVLRPDENFVGDDEYERRLTLRQGSHFGYQQAVWLVENQNRFPAFMALLGKIYIDFPGLTVVGANGNRSFPYLNENGKRWYLYWSWPSYGLPRHGCVASK